MRSWLFKITYYRVPNCVFRIVEIFKSRESRILDSRKVIRFYESHKFFCEIFKRENFEKMTKNLRLYLMFKNFSQFFPNSTYFSQGWVAKNHIAAQQCAEWFHNFYVFLCAIVHDNFCEIKRFIINIYLNHILGKFQNSAKKIGMHDVLPARWMNFQNLGVDTEPWVFLTIFLNLKKKINSEVLLENLMLYQKYITFHLVFWTQMIYSHP